MTKRLNYKYQKEANEAISTSTPVLLFERRVLTFVTLLLFIGLASWLVAISTDYWVIVVAGRNGTVVLKATGDREEVYLWSHSGLWRRCDIFAPAASSLEAEKYVTTCHYHPFEEEESLVRVEAAFVSIVLLLIGLSVGFSFYSLYHPRYTFKRVAGGLHLLTAVLLIVLIQMVASEGHLAEMHHHAKFERQYFGYSYLMAWITFIISVLASLAFFAWSKKRKHLAHDLETQLK